MLHLASIERKFPPPTMRFINVVASLAVTLPVLALSQGATSPNFECPEEDIVATQCFGVKECLYSNPDDCSTYIKCEVNADGRTATAHVEYCPAGLKWNDSIKECDFLVRNVSSDRFPRILTLFSRSEMARFASVYEVDI
jgi:hypothetical protein